jgi:arylformamidase
MLLACVWKAYAPDLPMSLLKNALGISGVYELAPLRLTPFLMDSLRLTPMQVRKVSPALLPRPRLPQGRGEFYAVVGGAESAEFLRQNQLIREAWGPKVVPVCEALPGLNHFSVLETLIEPGHRLNTLAWELLLNK